jgi:hypothetical protein
MGKSKRVPPSQRNELAEYASLLRSLRTNDLLDISSRLGGSSHASASSATPPDDPYTLAGERHPSSTSLTGAAGRDDESEPTDSVPYALGSSEIWTRWPLLPDEVQTTEWGFSDEIRVLVSQALSISPNSYHNDESVYDANVSTEGDADTLLDGDDIPDNMMRVITEASAAHLERILASLVNITPHLNPRSRSRMGGIGWEIVLQTVSAAGLADAMFVIVQILQAKSFAYINNNRTIETVQRRLEQLYGPASMSCVYKRATYCFLVLSVLSDSEHAETDAYYRSQLAERESRYDYIALPFAKPSNRGSVRVRKQPR